MKLTARKFSLESLINTAKTEITVPPVSSTSHITWGPITPRPPLPEIIKALKEESTRIYQLCKAMEGELVLDAMSKTKADVKDDIFTSSGVSIQSSPNLPQNPNWVVNHVVNPCVSSTTHSSKDVGINYYEEVKKMMAVEQFKEQAALISKESK